MKNLLISIFLLMFLSGCAALHGLGAVMKGAGNGMAQANQNSVQCYSYVGGQYIYTNCQ